jgi:hypothetical protein
MTSRCRRRHHGRGQVGQVPGPAPGLGRGGPHHDGRRRGGAPAARDQPLRDARPLSEPHQHHQRESVRGQAVDQRTVCLLVVTGHDHEARGHSPVRHRDARQRGRRDRRRHAGDHLARDAGARQRQRLLAAAAEHERVAALEPHHLQPAARVLDQQAVQHLLLDRRPTGPLADVEPARARRQLPHLLRGQRVVEDEVGLGQPPRPAHREQIRVAGAGAHQGDAAARRRRMRLAAHDFAGS